MCTSWSEFRDDLRFILHTKRNIKRFNNLQRSLPGSFLGPEGVVAFLSSGDNAAEDRDAVLRALVSRVQNGGSDSNLAFAILALGRWQDLDQIFRRRFKRFPHDVDELVSLVRVGLTTAVLRADLLKTKNVAVNLSLSTERLVSESFSKAWKANQMVVHPEYGVDFIKDRGESRESAFGFPTAMSPDKRFAILQGLAHEAAGKNADLVVAVDVVGETLVDVAEELGISYEAAKKRRQYAIEKIEESLRAAGLAPRPRNATTPATTRCKGDVRPGGL